MNSGTVSISNLTSEDKTFLIHKNSLMSLESYQLTPSDKRDVFQAHREKLGDSFGFDWHKMFMADQENKDGSFFEITQDYVDAFPNGWSDIPEDILIVTDKVPGVVIGHPVADCPVVMMCDLKKGAVAVGHCSAEMINKHLPVHIFDALRESFDARAEDIVAYVGACAGKDWTYDCYPKWATDESVWDGAIFEKDGLYYIDLSIALDQQLSSCGISAVTYNPNNTRTCPMYYSNSMFLTHPQKYGRHFEGVFFDMPKDKKRKQKTIR